MFSTFLNLKGKGLLLQSPGADLPIISVVLRKVSIAVDKVCCFDAGGDLNYRNKV